MVLVLAVIVLIIRHKRKNQYDVVGKTLPDTSKPLGVKSSDKETEFIFPNPTYQDNEFSVVN